MEKLRIIMNLMRADIISLLGFKKRLAVIIAAATVLSVLTGAFFIPVYSLVLLTMAILITSDIINLEAQTGSGKLTSVLPTDRQSVVYARFALGTLTVTGFGAVMFALMQLSMKLRIYALFMEYDEIFELMGIPSSADNVFNVLFGCAYFISLAAMSFMLKGNFKHGAVSSKNSLIKTFVKLIIIYVAFSVTFAVLIKMSTLPILGSLMTLITGVIAALADPLKGVLLLALLIAAGLGHTVYMAVSSMIEYEKREL